MNENIDLTKILKDCPKGWKFYSSIYGDIEFVEISSNTVIFKLQYIEYTTLRVFYNGKYTIIDSAECIVFPSKNQRDWSKFSAPWYKKERFDPKTLKPFDKVLVRSFTTRKWRCKHFSCFMDGEAYPYMCFATYRFCVPYNEDTKQLVGTNEEAPEYYRYWEE